MHTYSVWSSERGPQTTAITASLARAQAERGDRVLVVDFTPPGGGLTEYFGLETQDRYEENIVSHLLEEDTEPFDELIRSAESGVDIVPTHDYLAELDSILEQNAVLSEQSAPRIGYEYPKTEQLHRVLSDSKVFYQYDIILVDSGTGINQCAYNGVYAAPNVLIPFEAGTQVETLESEFETIEETLDSIEVDVLGTVPTGLESDGTGEYANNIADVSAELPATGIGIDDCPSLFEDVRVAKTSFHEFEANEEYRQLEDHERDILESVEELAEYVSTELKPPY
ncbi:ParA family protein [Halostagnicola sp. A-GB9-2]|uniref:ParA family protein n=1 Tax=Halostagnicola sp. A-GB9-2 TaxID=3048066 RepID=UPI0024BFC9AF|nr:ParA family protein [Halostagnicola sp. A-GB9-2]MDJ1434030.1 ParA family protein [Halostagnicola sp. A-GB9-2]